MEVRVHNTACWASCALVMLSGVRWFAKRNISRSRKHPYEHSGCGDAATMSHERRCGCGRGQGSFDCVAQDDSEGTYRFFPGCTAGTTKGRLTGTIAPFDGSAAACARVSTSSW